MRYFLLIVLISFQTLTWGQAQFCLSFTNPQITDNGTKYKFDINMTRNATAFNLGTSNLVFTFNNSALANPSVFNHTLSILNYDVPTLTNPLPNRASLNIVLNNDGMGILVNTTPTKIATASFDILNPALMSNLLWLYTGTTIQTVVFDDLVAPNQLYAIMNDNVCLQSLSSPLPVDLVSFSATAKLSEIVVDWVSSSEVALSHYEVERSTEVSGFTMIDQVNAKNQRGTMAYNIIDYKVKPGIKYYYRLKMTDHDGKYKYSDVVEARIVGDSKASINVFPNPIGKNSTLNIISTSRSTAAFKLYDANQKLITSSTFVETLAFSTAGLPQGMYFYIIDQDGTQTTGKVEVIE